jgi:autotransporter-associated beta strand protein
MLKYTAFVVACASLIVPAVLSKADVIVAEDFTYADGDLNGQNGGKGFSNVWTSATKITGGVSIGNGTSTRSLASPFPSSGTLWVSFDWGFASNPNPQAQFGGLTFFEGETERHLIGDVWDTGVWGLNGGSATSQVNHGGMKTGVVKITLGAGPTSSVELWVGPTGSLVDVSGEPMAKATGRDLDGVDSIRIMGSSFEANINQSFDNLRIGTNVEDVVNVAAAKESKASHVSNENAVIDHVAMATSNMQAADAAWTAGNWEQVRSSLTNVFNDLKLSAQWRSIAHLRYARSFQAAGDFAKAGAIFAEIADNKVYQKIHQIEGAECKIECERLAQGKPARDPEASRVRVPAAPKPGRTLYVAADGKDTNAGTREQPFATVSRALAANRNAGAVAGGTVIELAAGRYPLAETISLTEMDSGSTDAPLTIRAATPGTAVISGSKRLTGFTAVTDKSVLARMPQEARGKVMQCDLAAQGITDFGSIQEQPMVNLAVNGVPQNLARWPNSGFVRIGDMVDNGNIDHNDPQNNRPQIFTTSDRISRWTTAPDAWLQGYLATNWMYGSVAVGSFDAKAKTITTALCYTRLSGWPDIKSGHPYAVFNLLEEIDQPGEWYLDRAKGLLYLYPSAVAGKATVDLSMLSGPMLTVTNASHVRVEGLVLEGGRSSGVELQNASDCLIVGCTVRHVSGVGVSINGGKSNAMIGCYLHDLEHAACHINGGDIDTLTSGGHVVANCRFRNFGRTSRSAGISLNGVGHRITHCVLEDCPSSAIGFAGFHLLVEYSEFRNCCNEIDDYGVIYAWGNPTWRGNIWRFNKFSHCGGGYTQGWVQNRYFGTSAFRFDDAVSGQTVYGNVFTHFDLWGTSAGVMGNNTGRDNIYDNNVVTDSRGLNYGYFDGGNHMYKQGLPNGVLPAHLAAFPELANLNDGKGQNFIWRTTMLRVSAAGTNSKNSNYADSEWGGWQYIGNTSTGTDPGFVAGVELKKTIDPKLFWNLGMRAIPVDEIGLYEDPTSAAWHGKSAVFAEPGGTITLTSPLVADELIFTAPGYSLAGSQPIIVNAPMTTIDAKNFDATISTPLLGLGSIRMAGPATLTLSGINRYNGTTTVESGTLALSGGDNRLPPGTVVTLGGGGPASVGTLKLNGCNQELDGLWTADHDSGGSATNRVINGSATPCTLTLNIEQSRQNQFVGTLGGSGQDENNFALRKTGGGTLWLNRSITWTGGTTIEEGSLELSSTFWQGNHASGLFRIGKGATFAVSGQVSPLTFNNVTVEFLSGGGGSLVNRGSSDWLTWLVDGEMTIRSTGGERNLFSAAPSYGLSLNGKNLLCDVARGSDATCDFLVSIPLSGDGNLTKTGKGIMNLTGSNSYGGATTVNAGTLLVDTTGKLGKGNLTVENGASCGLRNSAGAVADNATVTLNGTAKLYIASGVSETIGTLVIDGIQKPQGVWNAAKDPVHFSGGGSLVVTSGPKP